MKKETKQEKIEQATLDLQLIHQLLQSDTICNKRNVNRVLNMFYESEDETCKINRLEVLNILKQRRKQYKQNNLKYLSYVWEMHPIRCCVQMALFKLARLKSMYESTDTNYNDYDTRLDLCGYLELALELASQEN